MRQVKRLFYLLLLNIIVSAITVLLILNLWERNHPPLSTVSTPVVIVVTPVESMSLPLVSNQIDPTLMPTDTGVITLETPAATYSIEMLTYKVKEGDTLGALATEFNISVADIMTVNGLTDPDSLYVGQILLIPTEPLPTITPTPTVTKTATATPIPSATATHGPTVTSTQTPSPQDVQLIIETVIGAGSLANEHVVLQRTGDGELSLIGWRLDDGIGNTYYFPHLTLFKGVTINLNTRSGEDTVLDLFWGLTYTVWGAGKTVYLYDAQNNLRDSYTVP